MNKNNRFDRFDRDGFEKFTIDDAYIALGVIAFIIVFVVAFYFHP